jgi:hypothetical protein
MKRPAAGHLAHFFHVQFLLVTHAYVPPSAMRVYSKDRSSIISQCHGLCHHFQALEQSFMPV